MIYIFIFTILFILSINKGEKKKKDKVVNLVIYFITFILAFNYKMGTDWLIYQRYYELEVIRYSFKDILFNNPFRLERGYIILNLLGNKIGLNYEFFMAVLIIFCIINILKIGSKKSKNYYIFVLIIFVEYIFGMSIEPVIRQFIAVTIIVIGYQYIEKKELLKFFLIILVAIQFHTSAVIGFGAYFLDKINISKKRLCFLVIFIFIIIKILPFLLVNIANLTSNKYFYIYADYFNNSIYGISRSRSIKESTFIFIITLIYLYIVFFAYDNSKNKKNYIKNMALIYIICGHFQNILPILYRIQGYFVVPFAIALSYSSQLTFFNKKIIFYKNSFKYIIIIFTNILFIFIFIIGVYGRELNKIRYGNYRNYFIEKVKGNVADNFEEKKKGYEENIEKLVKKENNKELNNK